MGNVGQRGILERIQKRVVRGTSPAREREGGEIFYETESFVERISS